MNAFNLVAVMHEYMWTYYYCRLHHWMGGDLSSERIFSIAAWYLRRSKRSWGPSQRAYCWPMTPEDTKDKRCPVVLSEWRHPMQCPTETPSQENITKAQPQTVHFIWRRSARNTSGSVPCSTSHKYLPLFNSTYMLVLPLYTFYFSLKVFFLCWLVKIRSINYC